MNEDTETNNCVITHPECGGWLFVSMNTPSFRSDIKRAMSRAIDKGWKIEFLPTVEVRERVFKVDCTCYRKAKRPGRAHRGGTMTKRLGFTFTYDEIDFAYEAISEYHPDDHQGGPALRTALLDNIGRRLGLGLESVTPEAWAERAATAGEVLDVHERDCIRCLTGSCPLKDSLDWWYRHCCQKGGL